MQYNARQYSPVLGRFLQPDTIVPDPGNGQALNRYSYALNSPTDYTDPSGHSVDCGIGDAYCKAGKLDVQQRALDLYYSLGQQGAKQQDLTKGQIAALAEGGFVPDDLGPSAIDASGTVQDPIAWVAAAYGGIRLIPLGMQIGTHLLARCVSNFALCERILTGSGAGLTQANNSDDPLTARLRSLSTLGDPGRNSNVRVLPGGVEAARAEFDALTTSFGGTIREYPNGVLVAFFENGTRITYRAISSYRSDWVPTISFNSPFLNAFKLKYFP